MSTELILLLALLLGVGAATVSAPRQPEDEATAQPSFFPFPDLTLPEFTFSWPSVAPPAGDMPYWFTETQRLYPGVTIKVGPLP